MKNFLETFTTAILLALTIFAVTSLMFAEAELVAARETHGMLLNAVQTSDPESVEDVYGLRVQLNSSVKAAHKNWNVDISKLESSNSRDYYLVTLYYTIDIPLFGNVISSKIQGYAK